MRGLPCEVHLQAARAARAACEGASTASLIDCQQSSAAGKRESAAAPPPAPPEPASRGARLLAQRRRKLLQALLQPKVVQRGQARRHARRRHHQRKLAARQGRGGGSEVDRCGHSEVRPLSSTCTLCPCSHPASSASAQHPSSMPLSSTPAEVQLSGLTSRSMASLTPGCRTLTATCVPVGSKARPRQGGGREASERQCCACSRGGR